MSAPAEQATLDPTIELLRLWSVTTLIDMALGMGPGLVNWIVLLTASFRLAKEISSVRARCPMKPPAKQSPAPVGS